mmetsp:Transcript_9576/g.23863  ORF Transcript_9576/g.23863 Transcript_9576/m.23863 type:complete len:255 (+) Transcript_9576:6897-7661(+)
MPDVCKPVRILGKGNTALLVHCCPNVSGGHSMPWPKNSLVKFGQDNLVLHLYEPKLVSALCQVCGHGFWEGFAIWFTRQQRQKVLAPGVMFHPVRGRLDKIHRGTGSRHVLKVGSAEQRVEGMPKLVQKGFDLLVGGKAGLSRVHVAHQCNNRLLVVGIRAIFQTATSYRKMGGVRVFSRPWMQIQIHGSQFPSGVFLQGDEFSNRFVFYGVVFAIQVPSFSILQFPFFHANPKECFRQEFHRPQTIRQTQVGR